MACDRAASTGGAAFADWTNAGAAISATSARAATNFLMTHLQVTDVVRGLLQQRGGRWPMPCSHRGSWPLGGATCRQHATDTLFLLEERQVSREASLQDLNDLHLLSRRWWATAASPPRRARPAEPM